MMRKTLSILLALLVATATQAAELRDDHPDRYVVVKGDTLWDISARFLRKPWLWPEIWHVNPQVANPHLIYPGDVLTLVYIDGQPRLVRDLGPLKLSPRVRSEPLEDAIVTIPMDVIRPFLSDVRVFGENELEAAPYIVAPDHERLIVGGGDRVYARGIPDVEKGRFVVFRAGDPYVDPDTGEVLGIEGIHIGRAQVQRPGDPATMLLTGAVRESLPGDRLVPSIEEGIDPYFTPRPPGAAVEGKIISVYEGVTQIGQYQVVVLNRGEREGLEPGHVLAVYRAGKVIADPFAPVEEDTVRLSEDEPDKVIPRYNPHRDEQVRLPDERAGEVMVFRTFERVSYALVMRATEAMHIHDKVLNP